MDSNFLVYAALPLFFSGISFLLTFGLISYLRDRKITLTLKYGKGGGSKLQSKIYLFGGVIVFTTTCITILIKNKEFNLRMYKLLVFKILK